MSLVFIRDVKTILAGTYSGTKLYPVINSGHFNQIPSTISYTGIVSTTKWTIHATDNATTICGAAVIELSYRQQGSNAPVYMGTQGGNVSGIITGINPYSGTNYLGIDVTTASVANVFYTIFVEGRISYYG